MRIGHLSTAYHTALILQSKFGEIEGLNPKWVLFGGGPPLIDALGRGELDIGYAGLPPAMIGIDHGVRIKCVAGGHMDGTTLVAKSSYKSLGELGNIRDAIGQFVGQVIAAPPKGSIHDVIVRHLLNENGINAEVRNFAWSDFIPLAMERGEVAAAVGTPALCVTMKNDLGTKIIMPPDKVWPNNPSYGIVAREEFIEEHPEEIETFLALHKRASALIRNEPDKAAEIVSSTIGFVGPGFVKEIYKISPRYCIALAKEFIDTTMEFVGIMKEMGYLSRALRREEIFETMFIEKIHPEEPHYFKKALKMARRQ